MAEPMPCEKCGQVHTRCSSHRRDGEPCTMAPRKGQKVCKMHGGSTPAAVVAGKSRYIEAKVRGELTKQGWQPIVDPLPAYADLTGEVWELKEIARQKVAELAGWAYTNDKGDEDVKATLAFYERMLDRTSKALVDMMRLGIDAQALRLAKARPSREQAEQFAAILDALDLTAEQSAKLPALLARLIGDDQ